MREMANSDRLTGLDTSFLHLERHGAHMHIASCLVFEGSAPPYDEFARHINSRLHLVPRYRQRLAEVPFGQGRPVWVDDPHFKLGYHLRHSALPAPGSNMELSELCGRVFSTQLDRAKPLWEIYLVDGLAGNRFALLAKTHHALVDGVSGMDITAVLFDLAEDAIPLEAPSVEWVAQPAPSSAELLGEALIERATVPAEMARGLRSMVRRPRRTVDWLASQAAGIGNLAFDGTEQAPETPLNVAIGPHRRFTWVTADLSQLKEIKNQLGGTVNDVVLTIVSGALGSFLRSRGHPTRDLVLRAMVPVSIRPQTEHGTLGNQVAAMWAHLPVGVSDPKQALALVSDSMSHVKDSGQAVGAHALTELTGFAPQTIMSQAARLVPRQRFFNLVVTNVPGPQFPLWLMGRRLVEIYPMVPLAERQALGIAVISYDGKVCFGFNADWDAIPDLDLLAEDLRNSLADLTATARKDGKPSRAQRGTTKSKRRSTATAAPVNLKA